MKPDASRHIPSQIKRDVRRRCGFGCVICGLPVYHYEHMQDFAVVLEHTSDNITLLCPNHHQEKTSGRLPRSRVQKANASPFNIGRRATASHSWMFEGDVASCIMGSCYFGCHLAADGDSFNAIEIRGEGVIGFTRSDDALLLNLRFLDYLQKPILVISEGEIFISTSSTDVKMEGRSLTIVPSFGLPKIKIKKWNTLIEVTQGHFIRPFRSVAVHPTHITIFPEGSEMKNQAVFNFRSGLSLW